MKNFKHLLVVGAVGLGLLATAALPANADSQWRGNEHRQVQRVERHDRNWRPASNGYYNNGYYNNGYYNSAYNTPYVYPYNVYPTTIYPNPYGYYPAPTISAGYYNNGTGISVSIPLH